MGLCHLCDSVSVNADTIFIYENGVYHLTTYSLHNLLMTFDNREK